MTAHHLLASIKSQAHRAVYDERDDSAHFEQFHWIKEEDIRARILIERAIVRRAVRDILAADDGAYCISVFDGGAFPVKRSRSLDEIMAEVGQCDEETLIVRHTASDGSASGKLGSIYLAHGNDGWDVIADHTDSPRMGELLAEANRLAELLGDCCNSRGATTMHAASIDAPAYAVGATDEDSIIARALEILARRVQKGELLSSTKAVRQYLTVKAAQHSAREVFSVLFMDSQNRLIECREMFFGTLNQTSVYPREVVRAAIELRAAACILSHNHPSGDANPSRADEKLTQMLKSALALIDVRVLDHIITAGGSSLSMAEQGMV